MEVIIEIVEKKIKELEKQIIRKGKANSKLEKEYLNKYQELLIQLYSKLYK